MSLVSALKNLLVPRKSSAEVTDLDTDWRAIEIWAQQVVAAIKSISGGGTYASLTGPGQTVTPGALTQAGGFTVNSATSGVALNATTSGQIVSKVTGSHTVTEVVSQTGWSVTGTGFGSPAIVMTDTGAGVGDAYFFMDPMQAGVFEIGSTPSFLVTATGGTVFQVADPNTIGFFGATPFGQQAGAGITTVAQLVTVLQNYGLLS